MTSYAHNLAIQFQDTVRAAPDAVALRMRDSKNVSYGVLDELSNQIAHWLLNDGVKQGDVVGIFHDKSTYAYASMLACLKTGVIYTNLDSDSPWERLRKIVATCEPAIVLTYSSDHPHQNGLADNGVRLVNVRSPEIRESLDTCSTAAHSVSQTITGAAPAYIMFTSGSTGVPKGAVISHSNVMNFIAWAKQAFGIGQGDLLSNANPMYFDNSVFDFYGSLFSGAALLPITADEVRDPRQIIRIINDNHCTVWFSVPSLLVYLLTTRALKADDFPSVRKLVFGGEGFPKKKLKELFDLFGERIQFENVYGPTECTCICSTHTVTRDDFQDMQSLTTLGHLARNFDYHILPTDPDNPDFGELFLTGPQVGLGYYNSPDRTAQAFQQNPHHNHYRDIGYRTGDLVYRDETQQLHFKGRADFQIKHMGYRIELEEIEAALSTISGVNECAVIYHMIAEGMGQIWGFASLSDQQTQPSDLINQIAKIVPAYMVPRKIQVLPSLPRNANGKIDRTQLQQFTGISS